MKKEFTTLSQKTILKNKWLAVRQNEFVRASGTKGTFYVVEKVDFAVIVAKDGDCLYLVEQYRYPLQARYCEFPQGSWESKQDPLDLARAELKEETGLVAETMQHAGRLYLAPGYSSQAYDVFLAQGLSQHETALDPEEEGLIARPFHIDLVREMILSGTIQDASTVASFGLLSMRGWL